MTLEELPLRYAAIVDPGNLLGELLRDRGAQRVGLDAPWDLLIADRGPDPQAALDALPDPGHGGVVSVAPGWDLLCSKLYLWRTLSTWLGREGAEEVTPPTYELGRADDRALLAARHTDDRAYALKAPGVQGGRGTWLARGLAPVLGSSLELAQEVLPDVLTVGGYRTKLRVYAALVVDDHVVELRLHPTAKVVYAAAPFTGDLADPASCVTVSTPITDAAGGPRTLADLWQHLRREGRDTAGFRRHLGRTLATVAGAALGAVRQAEGPRGYRFVQLLGVDVVLGEDGRAWVLEVNRGPDLGVRSLADGAIKLEVVTDWLRLAGLVTGGRGRHWQSLGRTDRAR